MDIAINIELALSNPTGMGRYARELLRHLMQLDSHHSYTLFHSAQSVWPPAGNHWIVPDNFRLQRLPYTRKRMLLSWFLYGGPAKLGKFLGKHHIYHNLSDVLLPVPSTRTIASLHDTSTAMFPQCNPWHSRLLFRKSREQLPKADVIVTVSNFSKEKIVELFKVHREKIAVIYGGVGSEFHRIEDAGQILRTRGKYGIPRDYFLFVGVFNRRKNLGSLLRAYHLYRSRHPRDHAALVCCGRPGLGSQEFFRDISGLDLSEDVKIVQGASDTELVELLSGSRALLLLSLLEGFGLPLVEAMACGTPVICGNRCAMSEVAGNAALCVDPMDIEQVADAMERLVSDTDLVQLLQQRGLERAKEFTWARTAQETLALYWRLR